MIKMIFDIRREAQSFYAGFSIFPPHNTCGTRHKATASSRKSPFFFGPQDSTQLTFSKSPKSSPRTSGAWRHSHPLANLSIWDFYFDICERHILPARTLTPALKFAPT